MKNLIGTTFLVSLASACATQGEHYVDYGGGESNAKAYGDTFDWQNRGPAEFLEHLKSVRKDGEPIGVRTYLVHGKHHDWIQLKDMPQLCGLLRSSEPCASVAMTASSYYDTKGSNVGDEAAYLIEGFKKGVYPSELNSFRREFEKSGLEEWCKKFLQKKSSP